MVDLPTVFFFLFLVILLSFSEKNIQKDFYKNFVGRGKYFKEKLERQKIFSRKLFEIRKKIEEKKFERQSFTKSIEKHLKRKIFTSKIKKSRVKKNLLKFLNKKKLPGARRLLRRGRAPRLPGAGPAAPPRLPAAARPPWSTGRGGGRVKRHGALGGGRVKGDGERKGKGEGKNINGIYSVYVS